MKSLLLVVVLGVALLGAASADCDIDDPGMKPEQAYPKLFTRIRTCVMNSVSQAMSDHLETGKSLAHFQSLFHGLCPHSAEVVTCLAGVRESLVPCHNKNVSVPFRLILDMTEHLLTDGCENDGDRIAHIAHGTFLLMKKRDTLIPLRRCLYKFVPIMKLADKDDVDMASESYIIYKETGKFKKCMQYVEDETYKPALQWFLDEVAQNMKCVNPEDAEHFVLCKDVDHDKLTTDSVCKLAPLNGDHLYDTLEESALVKCCGPVFSLDKQEGGHPTDMEWLRTEYAQVCKKHAELPTCLLELSAYGDACLSQEEDKQFQLSLQALELALQRACIEGGTRMSVVMHEVYRATPEHGNAFRDCYKTVSEASKGHSGHAASTKNMRFYHDAGAFQRCIVERLHETNEIAKNLEGAFDEIRKKMKCVNPEDGAVVLCETIHEHEH